MVCGVPQPECHPLATEPDAFPSASTHENDSLRLMMTHGVRIPGNSRRRTAAAAWETHRQHWRGAFAQDATHRVWLRGVEIHGIFGSFWVAPQRVASGASKVIVHWRHRNIPARYGPWPVLGGYQAGKAKFLICT